MIDKQLNKGMCVHVQCAFRWMNFVLYHTWIDLNRNVFYMQHFTYQRRWFKWITLLKVLFYHVAPAVKSRYICTCSKSFQYWHIVAFQLKKLQQMSTTTNYKGEKTSDCALVADFSTSQLNEDLMPHWVANQHFITMR